ncbi:MAG TPA: ribose-5-phosphate isomerase RpiA [Steroidobacteraceae bacterium]|nr:ribose-5-phosphate isomerase RpiA [Steroidobacteraceae bacterium]
MNTNDIPLTDKQRAATAALVYLRDDMVLGVGTGSTVNAFIDALGPWSRRLAGAVSSSDGSSRRLQSLGIPLLNLNDVDQLGLYIDGADEANDRLQLIKGGGAALTREKIIAGAAARFVCIVDESKLVATLGRFPLPIEVIPMARRMVSREIARLGGRPVHRAGCVTDNGNDILDVHDLVIDEPVRLESQLNQLAGVVTVGLFAARPADLLLIGGRNGVRELTASLPAAASPC